MSLVLASLGLATARPAAATDVTVCDQVVAEGDVGVLQGDLDCPMNGVRLEAGATLSLNGHELRGGSNIGVYCRKSRCTIEGPGTITSADWIGVFLEDRVHLIVRNVTLRGNDVAILGSNVGRNKVTASDVTIEDSLQWALSARSLRATNLTVRGNAPGGIIVVSAGTVRIAGGDVSANGATALRGQKISLEGVTVTGNAGIGIEALRSVRLIGSTVTGNDAAGAGVDVKSAGRPKLVGSTCGLSADEDGQPWGVCTGD